MKKRPRIRIIKAEDYCPYTSDNRHVHIGGKKRSPNCNFCRANQYRQYKRDKVGDGIIRAEGMALDGCPVTVDDVLPNGNMIVELALDWKDCKKGKRLTIGPAEYMGY